MKTESSLRISEKDNVIVALTNYEKGDVIGVNESKIVLDSEIPSGHKIALQAIKEGENVIKYGHPIGKARKEIGRAHV